ncbi:MAG TPA: hypothetical protein DHW81_05410 [Nitrospiraceae bacterium]|nr:hypothetical protein [Nitrospiraceae bacterium]
MKDNDGINKGLSVIYIYVASAIVVWTIVLGASLIWDMHSTKKTTEELAKKEARVHFNKDQAFRFWGSKHGGVYVPATKDTPPNPNLSHVPERDIKTPSGRQLTLMNPAYMIRQMMNEFSELYGVKGRITSFKPLYPPNAPDEWEKNALTAFEKGVKEVFEFTGIDGEPYLRLMRPMITQKPCLKCHAFQGYKEGDIRGGVGVSVPMKPYLAVRQKTTNTLITAHFFLWIFGLAVIGFISVRARNRAFERIEAEEVIRRSKEFNETILNSMKDSIIVIDVVDYKIVSANNAFLNLYQLGEKDVIGKTCYEITHHIEKPCDLPDHPCPMVESLKDSGHTTYEHVHFSMDGSKRYVEVTTAPIRDAGGNIIQVVHSERDITERKRLEEQLRQAQKMEAIGLLAGGVAHDFNNMLTTIIGYGNLLRTNMREDDPLVTYAEQILSSGEKAANLTQSLLAFSRKQVINPKPVNLNEITASIEKILLRIIGEDIELKTTLSGMRDLRVMADAGQIEQVLMNLAANARDAMPEGGTLTIETGLEELDLDFLKIHEYGKQGMYAILTVTDTGHGMDENTRQRIFEPFFTTKEVGRGTGLGLSMVYGIIKQHSGYINCYSEPEKGTTFKIYLPVIESATEKTKKEEHITLSGGTETILLAEDEEEVRKLMRLALEEAGYKVIEAVDGKEAIEKFRENKDSIGLLLLDVIMPKMNGKGVYEEARKIKPGIKALFSSGYPADFIHKKGILEEGLNFISKPASPHEFLKRIREILNK